MRGTWAYTLPYTHFTKCTKFYGAEFIISIRNYCSCKTTFKMYVQSTDVFLSHRTQTQTRPLFCPSQSDISVDAEADKSTIRLHASILMVQRVKKITYVFSTGLWIRY